MAGAVMTFTEVIHTTVKKIKAEWTSDDTLGTVSGETTNPFSGRIMGAITVPDGVAVPTNLYDIEVQDADGIDVALGALANRSNVNTEFVAEASMAGIANDKITVAIAAAGNSKKGTLYLFIR